MREKNHAMTVMLTENGDRQVEELATLAGKSKAQIVREATAFMYAHIKAGKPTCADGRPCLAPQLHGAARTP